MATRKSNKTKPPVLPLSKPFLPKKITKLFLVGVGGTGSYLAQGLAKMVAGYNLDLDVILVDPDIVEEKNLYRQNFLAHEVGLAKAESLAFRLNQQFGTRFSHYVGDGLDLLTDVPSYKRSSILVVTCVDSVTVRQQIPDGFLWLDNGNGQDYGQAILGNCTDRKMLRRETLTAWTKFPNLSFLPSPKIKCGNWEQVSQEEQEAPSCADMAFFGEQGVYVNEWSAQAALSIIFQLLVKERVTVPAIYFNCNHGRMIPAKLNKEYLRQ